MGGVIPRSARSREPPKRRQFCGSDVVVRRRVGTRLRAIALGRDHEVSDSLHRKAICCMQQFVSESMSSQRFPMILLGAFASIALLLASIGTYGVISYSVTQRVHEIGIRMALGAEKRKIFQMVIGQGLRLAVSGLIIGAVAALFLTRLLSSFSHLLYGVGASDPVTFAAVSLTLAGAAILGCYVPARRASIRWSH